MTMPAELLLTGFADPALEAQAVFRAALEALARPGRIAVLKGLPEAPPPLGEAAAALGLALLDYDTPLWLDRAAEIAAGHFRFHCGCPIAAGPGAAAFALICEARAMPPLDAFAWGSDAEPSESATLIVEVGTLTEGGPLRLTGPGIATEHRIGATGLPDGFWTGWAANHAAFPRGVDLFLTCGPRLCGLPRTTRVEG